MFAQSIKIQELFLRNGRQLEATLGATPAGDILLAKMDRQSLLHGDLVS